MTWLDLVLFTGCVYGVSWVLTRSRLTSAARCWLVRRSTWLGRFSLCIVCMSAWVAAGMALLLPRSTLFSDEFRAVTVLDVLLLVAWSVAATWLVARRVGDAD